MNNFFVSIKNKTIFLIYDCTKRFYMLKLFLYEYYGCIFKVKYICLQIICI